MLNLGMDAEQVESVGHHLQLRASDLDGLVKRIDAIVRSVPGVWVGPVAERFVGQWWPDQRGILVAAVARVRGLGEAVLKNAAEQRDVSKAGADASRGGRPSGVGGTAVQSAADRYLLTRSAGDDGIRIQGVRGADGVVRYVVYIDGTVPDSFALRSAYDAIASEVGRPTLTRDYILAAMAAEIPPGAEVMLVGYSQGGIHAQSIAESKIFNVTDVMTFGSPYYDDGDSVRGYNVARIRDDGDEIPGTGSVNEILSHAINPIQDVTDKVGTAWRSILGDDAGAVQHEVGRLNMGQDLTYSTHAGTADQWAGPVHLGTHAIQETYIHGGNEYEDRAHTTREGRMVLESQSRYAGHVVSDSDAGVQLNNDYVDQSGEQRGESRSVT